MFTDFISLLVPPHGFLSAAGLTACRSGLLAAQLRKYSMQLGLGSEPLHWIGLANIFAFP